MPFLKLFFNLSLTLIAALPALIAQDLPPNVLIKKIDLKSHFVEVDRMQQIYAVSDDHTLLKFSASGELQKSFNENSLGAISSVDVSNPFQPLVFYNEYQTAVVLDRSLSELYRFKLSELNFTQIDALALSSDNMLWLYDPNNFKLIKFESNGTVNLESPDLSSILESSFFPKSLREAEFKVFANDPEKGMLIFDNFGNFIQRLSLNAIGYFQVSGTFLIWMDADKQLHRLHLKTFREQISPLTDLGIDSKDLLQLCIMPNSYLLRYPDRIELVEKSKP
jgi:hypothetical protein